MTFIKRHPFTLSGPDVAALPVVPDFDQIESDGSLFLFDATHPVSPLPSGAPTNGQAVPNILWERAASLIGSGSASSLQGTIANAFESTAEGVVERSSKGGIHICPSPTAISNEDYASIVLPDSVKAYMKTNVGHTFYSSIWSRITRADGDGTNRHLIQAIVTSTKFGLALCARHSALSGTVVNSTSFTNVVGPEFQNLAGVPNPLFASDTDLSGSKNFQQAIALVGQRSGFTGVANHGARIIYRATLEDLTASDRDWATVTALDQSAFTAAVATVGGRYYGDTTPTNAATFT